MTNYHSLYFRLLSFIFAMLSLHHAQAQQALSPYDSLGVMPTFRYYQLNNMVFTPDSLMHDKQIVMIYIKKGCQFCEQQGAIIGENLRRFKDVEFVFISKGDSVFIADYARRFNLSGLATVKFLQDNDHQYYKLCNASYTPSIHIYNKSGKMLLFHEGTLYRKALKKHLRAK